MQRRSMNSIAAGTMPPAIMLATHWPASGTDLNAASNVRVTGGLGRIRTVASTTIGWAVSTWFDRPRHIQTMRERAMRQDFSWERAARQYEDLYHRAVKTRRGG